MRKPVVIFDLDDVLVNLRDSLNQALNRVTRTESDWRDWHTFDLSKIYQIPHDKVLDTILQHNVLESCTPEPGAQKALQAVHEAGFHTVILTARAWHPSGREITENFLQLHQFSYDQLVLSDLSMCKTGYMAPWNNIHLYVDDHASHVRNACNLPNVKHSLLFERPWNQQTSHDQRISDLSEIPSYLSR